ncbi:MAG: AarF/UbiB family protein, partial [Candidatus Margulisiibacteriota bacterium]
LYCQASNKISLAHFAAAGEIIDNPSPKNWEEYNPYKSFEEFYLALWSFSTPVLYLLIRGLALSGEEGIFNSEGQRQELFDFFARQHINVGSDNAYAGGLIDNVTRAVATVPSPQDLFYFTGPLLASASLQNPLEAYPTESLFGKMVDRYLEQKEGDHKRLLEEIKAAKDPSYDLCRQLLAIRMKALMLGKRPQLRQTGNGLVAEFDDTASFGTFEDRTFLALSQFVPERRTPSGKISPVELGIRICRQMGAIGVRWLQQSGMYLDMPPKDRTLIREQAYDSMTGQSKLWAFNTMQREARYSDKFGIIFEGATDMDGIIGGGSIVTVYDVGDKDGERWAVGVKNPNAEVRTGEIRGFAASVLDDVTKKMPNDSNLRLMRILLDRSERWVRDEINDPEYIEKNGEFNELNDHRSGRAGRFTPAEELGWKVIVPRIKDTGTDWVRWEERIEGRSLASVSIGDKTDMSAGSISREDMKRITALISQNYLYQLLETGISHSDVHPGNFLVSQRGEAAIIDRKNLRRFSKEETSFLRKLIATAAGRNQQNIFDLIAAQFLEKTDPSAVKRIRENLLSKLDCSSPENFISGLLAGLAMEGMEVPLKWFYVIKNLIALNSMSRDAGFNNFLEAFFYSPSGKSRKKVLEAVLPKTSKELLRNPLLKILFTLTR